MSAPLGIYAGMSENDRDALYLKLLGARENLCQAQMLALAHWRADLGQAIHIIDTVGSTLPQWSKDNQPEYAPGT